jgi:hypothetical protein
MWLPGTSYDLALMINDRLLDAVAGSVETAVPALSTVCRCSAPSRSFRLGGLYLLSYSRTALWQAHDQTVEG